MPMTLRSSAFEHHGAIPRRYTCDGDDIAPPLEWAGTPDDTQALALIVDDPDAPDPAAPKRTFVHWVLHDLPASATALPEGARELPAGTRVGTNDSRRRDRRAGRLARTA
jgi:Raf kinase inhibitor-like YbhB/YbcL family protein